MKIFKTVLKINPLLKSLQADRQAMIELADKAFDLGKHDDCNYYQGRIDALTHVIRQIKESRDLWK